MPLELSARTAALRRLPPSATHTCSASSASAAGSLPPPAREHDVGRRRRATPRGRGAEHVDVVAAAATATGRPPTRDRPRRRLAGAGRRARRCRRRGVGDPRAVARRSPRRPARRRPARPVDARGRRVDPASACRRRRATTTQRPPAARSTGLRPTGSTRAGRPPGSTTWTTPSAELSDQTAPPASADVGGVGADRDRRERARRPLALHRDDAPRAPRRPTHRPRPRAPAAPVRRRFAAARRRRPVRASSAVTAPDSRGGDPDRPPATASAVGWPGTAKRAVNPSPRSDRERERHDDRDHRGARHARRADTARLQSGSRRGDGGGIVGEPFPARTGSGRLLRQAANRGTRTAIDRRDLPLDRLVSHRAPSRRHLGMVLVAAPVAAMAVGAPPRPLASTSAWSAIEARSAATSCASSGTVSTPTRGLVLTSAHSSGARLRCSSTPASASCTGGSSPARRATDLALVETQPRVPGLLAADARPRPRRAARPPASAAAARGPATALLTLPARVSAAPLGSDAPLVPEAAGGPVLDAEGRLVGIGAADGKTIAVGR